MAFNNFKTCKKKIINQNTSEISIKKFYMLLRLLKSNFYKI